MPQASAVLALVRKEKSNREGVSGFRPLAGYFQDFFDDARN